jgi:hypothetical protein
LQKRIVRPSSGAPESSSTGDTAHLAQARVGVLDEVDDELGEHDVERAVGERQLLDAREAHVRARHAPAARVDERVRRIDGRDGVVPDELCQRLRETRSPRRTPAASMTAAESCGV